MHLSMKLSKKNFRGILRPKSVSRTLVIGLIYGPRANKQFDIAFGVIWTLPYALIGNSDSLIFKPKRLLTIFMFESWLMQMPGPRDIMIYWPGPLAFSVLQKPGAGHTFWCN